MGPLVKRNFPVLFLLPLVGATEILLVEGLRNVPDWLILFSLFGVGIALLAVLISDRSEE